MCRANAIAHTRVRTSPELSFSSKRSSVRNPNPAVAIATPTRVWRRGRWWNRRNPSSGTARTERLVMKADFEGDVRRNPSV
ncbi:MAG: hypothetical protein DMG07_01575 [Acidobacteria bacterium]|nr:MAG: hypothetical protein DMG07_01575 [Acidobacteriota bacterium]